MQIPMFVKAIQAEIQRGREMEQRAEARRAERKERPVLQTSSQPALVVRFDGRILRCRLEN